MSQTDRILDILENEGKVDNFRAIHSRLTLRLGARIHDLRQRGYVITTEELPDKNTVYRLISKPAPRQLTLTGGSWYARENRGMIMRSRLAAAFFLLPLFVGSDLNAQPAASAVVPPQASAFIGKWHQPSPFSCASARQGYPWEQIFEFTGFQNGFLTGTWYVTCLPPSVPSRGAFNGNGQLPSAQITGDRSLTVRFREGGGTYVLRRNGNELTGPYTNSGGVTMQMNMRREWAPSLDVSAYRLIAEPVPQQLTL
jgi:hypothetical protein